MSSDDFEVIAYKILSYLYACLKQGKEVDISSMRSLAGCNEFYFSTVVKNLQSKGFVDGFHFDGLSGVVMDSNAIAAAGCPAITMDGAVFVKENSRMSQVKKFLGHAFDIALNAVIETATPRL